MNEHLFSSLVARVSKDGSYSTAMVNTLGGVLRVSNDFEATRGKISADRHLSPEGKRAKAAEAAKGAVKDLLEASKGQRWALAQVVGEKMHMKPKPVSAEDARGELRRSEIRAYVRSLPQGQRITAALELAKDDDALDALLDAPAALSGLPVEQFKHLTDVFSQRHHGKRLAELEAMEKDAEVAKAGVDVVLGELKTAAGLPDHLWNEHVDAVRGEVDGGF